LTLRFVAASVEARGLRAEFELMVPTPGGAKSRRFLDIVGRSRETGAVLEMHQVGRQTKRGLPVSREVRALDDIQSAMGLRPTFHPYNANP
jgi:hypothetical protein